MRKFRPQLFTIIAWLFLSLSCSKSYDQKTQYDITAYLKKVIGTSAHRPPQSIYMVIPDDICPPCIKKYQQFIQKTPDPRVQFVLTGTGRKKIALTFGRELLTRKNVHIEAEGLWLASGLHNDLAQVFYFENEHLQRAVSITPASLPDELERIITYFPDAPSFADPAVSDSLRLVEQQMLDGFLASHTKFAQEMGLKLVGKSLERITGLTVAGGSFDSYQSRGKVLVLNFWIFRCGPCMEEIPDLNQINADTKNEDFIFVSICADTNQEIEKMLSSTQKKSLIIKGMEKRPIYFPVVGNGKAIATKNNIRSYPLTLVVNRQGVVQYVVLYAKNFEGRPLTYKLVKRAIDLAS